MNIAVWIVSGILAVVYLGAGAFKLVVPKKKLLENPNMAFVEGVPQNLIWFIGVCEVAGGLGLILPRLTGIAPILTPLAAAGLALLQVGALIFHGRRREFSHWPANIVLLAVAVFLAFENFHS